MHTKLREAVSAKFSGTHLIAESSTSETMPMAIQIHMESRRPGSSGTLVNGMQAKVIDTESGGEWGEKEEGELLVRSSLVRSSLVRFADRDIDSDGWFHNGHYGFLDRNCNVYIIDRLKERLRVGDAYGSRISTKELEAALFEHPSVASVIVVAIHTHHNEIDHPTAYVVLNPDFAAKAGLELAEEVEQFAGH